MTCFQKYENLTLTFIEKELTVATMESCTSGLVASLITDTEGASAVLKGGFVTYSNYAKTLCGVDENVIEKYGVYSRETAESMAVSCREKFKTDIGIGITGTFGNTDPANSDSVMGEVHIAIDFRGQIAYNKLNGVDGDRKSAKLTVAEAVADTLLGIL